MKKIVIASSNVGKLNEIGAILAPLDIEVIPQSMLNVPEAPEPYITFVENALAKARNASHHTGLPALADDSGLCVDALSGAPGVRSARFAVELATKTDGTRESQDRSNNLKLLDLLKTEIDRKARFYCVIVLTRAPNDPQPIICDAEWHGEILREPRGSGGFGYDSLFLVPQLGMSSAEIPAAQKNTISHRAQALALLAVKLGMQIPKETTVAPPEMPVTPPVVTPGIRKRRGQ